MKCFALLVLMLAVLPLGAAEKRRAVDYVNPFIGTGGHGHTFPGPTWPFGMVQLSPDTRLTGWDGCSGYHDSDRVLFGFSHTHLQGTGVSDYGDILLLPFTGPVLWQCGYRGDGNGPSRLDETGYGSSFRKGTETARAGYYRVHLDRYGVDVELTATPRSGWHRYVFPGGHGQVLIDLQQRDEVLESSLRLIGRNGVAGTRRSKGWAVDQRVFFEIQFNQPFQTAKIAVDDKVQPGLHQASGRNVKAVLTFVTRPGQPLLVKVGLSPTSENGAGRNLAVEARGWDFAAVRTRIRAAWEKSLARVVIQGAAEEQKTIFYTALYHTMVQPNIFQDADGRQPGITDATKPDFNRYTVFSLWDTFRAAHPLYTILEPRRSVDFILTFLAHDRGKGRLPVWELAGNETDCMIGYHSASVIVDAWFKGIRDFDGHAALQAMLRSADADRFGLAAYRRDGFIAADQAAESVSRTLEYAYDDWCIARLAADLGHSDVAARFQARSRAWLHLLDPDGFMRPRRNGQWEIPFDPREVTFAYTEANAYQYSLFVPHDLPLLIERLGGREKLREKLDVIFTDPGGTTGRQQADITGLVGQYAHGNEPSHHMAYLYAYTDAPWKTQAMVGRLLKELYGAGPDGLCGNEDCGQMSAWYVLSALGFYSVTPGSPDYVLNAPLFESVVIRLDNGRFFSMRTERESKDSIYVQRVTLNGHSLEYPLLSHAAIVAGGELVFRLGTRPGHMRPIPLLPSGKLDILPVPSSSGPAVFSVSTRITLQSESGATIHYSTNDTAVSESSPIYREPLDFKATTRLRFRAFKDGQISPEQATVLQRLDPRRQLTLHNPVHRQYRAGGDNALIDGIRGGNDFRLGGWQGYYGVDLQADLDLGEEKTSKRVTIGFIQDQNSWIFMPLDVTIQGSVDGKEWRELGRAANPVDPHAEGAIIHPFVVEFAPLLLRFLRLQARSPVQCPAWHKGYPELCFIFADEIDVE